MKNKNLLSSISPLLTIAIMITVFFIGGCNKKDDTMMNKQNDNMGNKTDNSMGMNNSQMMSKSMDNMMSGMHKMKMTGNMDIDYVTMMIMHHQAAIEMAKTEVSSGKDEKVKGLAANIIKDQKLEIDTMQNWLNINKNVKSPEGDNSSKLMSSMMGMMGENKLTGNVDKDFLSMMIVHHQGAIDMANVEIKYGTDPKIVKMSQDVVLKQSAEITQMKEWQK